MCRETQQNSVVERKHLHILNIARTLLHQSNVPIKVWGECVKSAVFLMNRTPSPILQHKSPYEILHQQLPNYSDFRTFGTLCYASTLLSTWHKFSPRAIATVFIGYPHGYKGYKLLDLTTLETFISRDVKFFEHMFPFKDKDSTTRSTNPLSPHITPNLITPSTCDDSDPTHTPYHHLATAQQETYHLQMVIQTEIELKWNCGKTQGKTCSAWFHTTIWPRFQRELFPCG